MTDVLQLHACWAPSRTTHVDFLPSIPIRCGIVGRRLAAGKFHLYSETVSYAVGLFNVFVEMSGKKKAHSLGYIFADRVASIPSLRCRYHPIVSGWETDRQQVIYTHHSVTFSSEFIHISIPILFPWAFRGTQSVVKHPSSRFIMKFLFFLMWPSYHCPTNHASAAVPRYQIPGFGLLSEIFCQCDRFPL